MYFRIKKLEQGWNRLFIRAVGKLFRWPPAEQPDWDARPYRVLYPRYDKIGDMIVSTSLIEAIVKSHPTITLDVLASPLNAAVLEGNPHVGSVIVWEKTRVGRYARLWRELRSRHYDAVIDSMVLSPSTTTLLLMLGSGARHRIGIGGRINDYVFTIPVPAAESPAHHIEHSAVLVRAFGLDPDKVDWRPTLYFSDEELAAADSKWRNKTSGESKRSTSRLLINISAGRPDRRWPDDRYVALIHHLQTHVNDLDILLVSSPAEKTRGDNIAKLGGVRRAPTPKLRDALALVATTDLVVTPDTSIAHAASACNKPAVILFEKGLDRLWGKFLIPGRNVVNNEKTLSTLPLEPVIEAVDDLIEEMARSR